MRKISSRFRCKNEKKSPLNLILVTPKLTKHLRFSGQVIYLSSERGNTCHMGMAILKEFPPKVPVMHQFLQILGKFEGICVHFVSNFGDIFLREQMYTVFYTDT